MDIFELIIIGIFVVGIGFILYLIFRDPILMFKSFLRGLKADNNWILKILFFSTWGAKKFEKLLLKEYREEDIPSVTTIHNILNRNGLVCPQKRVRRVKPSYPI